MIEQLIQVAPKCVFTCIICLIFYYSITYKDRKKWRNMNDKNLILQDIENLEKIMKEVNSCKFNDEYITNKLIEAVELRISMSKNDLIKILGEEDYKKLRGI